MNLAAIKSSRVFRFTLNLTVYALIGCAGIGCASSGIAPGSSYEEQHGPFAGRVVTVDISRRLLDQAVSRGGSFNSLRMVQVFRSADESGINPTPQYRLFDIQSGSVYDLVGLKTNDVLLAADGLVIYDPQGFKTYVTTVLRAVPNDRVSEIFISRAGVPIRLRIKTVS